MRCLSCICRAVTLAITLLAVAACTGRPAPAALAPVAPDPVPPVAVPGAVDYRIDPTRSQLRVLVHRGGALAALGHNHVIVDEQLTGWIRLAAQFETSAFYLQLAPEDFVVDPPAARAEEGADFAEPVDDDARAGTRRNMLRPNQLDAVNHPLVLVRSVGVQRRGQDGLLATLRVTVAGHTRLLTLPCLLDRDGQELRVSADFPLLQSALGLLPLKVLMGQLQVEDELQLKLRLTAMAVQPPAAP